LQALAVLVLALLPGALYMWSFERQVGSWGASLSDRAFRFVEFSALLHALMAPVTFWFWRSYVITDRLTVGRISLALWALPIVYVFLPILAGHVVGRATRRRKRWAKVFTGPAPAPRAWDHLFGSRPDGWVLLRMKSGVWLGGAFAGPRGDGLESYAAGYPDEQDLFLAQSAIVDPDTGEFMRDAEGKVILGGSGILVRWEEVEYLEFTDS